MVAQSQTATADPQTAVDSNPFWYHTIEVAPGVVTPGWFDLRPIVDRLPWPDIRGKRCLDVGTADGFLAFELERRGAAEVVATDLADHELWDWPERIRARGQDYLAQVAGPEKGAGFRVARTVLQSSVKPKTVSAYDLSPDLVGSFDVVTCGSLLLHLRDPVRALQAIRSVCQGHLLCTNQIDVVTTCLHPRRPLARLDGYSDDCQWWLPNRAGHRQMLESAGFVPERETRPYAIPFGPGYGFGRRSPRAVVRGIVTGGPGVPHHAVLARPVR